MATFRGTIPDFGLANPLYVGAQVSFFTVDADGAITATLATLYADAIGTQTVSNPQTLDSEGKFERPVYIAGPVIGSVVGPNVSSHNTGVINARGTWRGDYVAGTVYFANDGLKDPVSGNIYGVAEDYTSVSLTADVLAGKLEIWIDQVDILTGGGGLAIKPAVRVTTTANITLAGLQTIDGVLVAAGDPGDRVLANHQTAAAQNGIYNVAAGAWTRATDADTSAKFANGCIVKVTAGDLNRGKGFQLSIPTPFVLNTTPNNWVAEDFPYASIPVMFSSAPDTFLQAGAIGDVNIPFDCTINTSNLFGDAVGSCVIDILKSGYANYPPTASICAAALPTLSAQQIAQDTTLTGWTLLLRQGDVLRFRIVSASGLKTISLSLLVNRN